MTVFDQLKRDEGLRLTPYKDTVGKLTIGYGRNLDDKGITKAEAEYMLTNDLADASVDLRRALPWTDGLDPIRRGVLVNMVFNMGVGNEKKGLLSFKGMLAAIQAGHYETAAIHMLASKWAVQVGDRARRLAQQMREGKDII